ncbi:hypothetical protein Sango_1172600 [Sesamum angolense]|uniref:Reverse transcriptase Ty1/copia-type domain-containing protein n=1 Tax=Sesamum angolense TaxID=2727404 RepID=A0AAE1WW69_9LAMI|nr:hypothetical protein Sango_1172600 [Sesamum angolense]
MEMGMTIGLRMMRAVGIFTLDLIYRARRKAIEEIEGGHAESFAKLPYSTHMVSATNEGSIATYNVHDDGSSSIIPIVPSFKKIFLGLLVLSNGFMAGNNPFIGFYGCHLKGPFGGVLLATIGLDWNNGLFLIAFDIAEMKCKKSWIFFFEHLSNMVGCFSHDRPWTFMSDRQKGLMETINEVIPHAIHRKCVRHIFANFKHQFAGASLKKYLSVWDIRGIPCRHAALGITYRDNLENFTDNLFTNLLLIRGYLKDERRAREKNRGNNCCQEIKLIRCKKYNRWGHNNRTCTEASSDATTKVNEGNPHGEISQFDMTAATNVPLADILQRIRGTKRKDQVDSSQQLKLLVHSIEPHRPSAQAPRCVSAHAASAAASLSTPPAYLRYSSTSIRTARYPNASVHSTALLFVYLSSPLGRWASFQINLSGLDNNLKMVRDHLLASASVPTQSNALSHVLCVATGTYESSSSYSSGTPTESSAMDLQTWRTIGGGHEYGGLYFIDSSTPVDKNLHDHYRYILVVLVQPLPRLLIRLVFLLLQLWNPIRYTGQCLSISLRKAWKMAMDEEMSALISRGIWELVDPLPNADVVACRWVFTVKFWVDATLERYKARLFTKGFTQTYGVDYFKIFLPVARLIYLGSQSQLADVSYGYKNAFLYCDLNETVYMEQPPDYVAQGEKQRMCQADHLVLVQNTGLDMVVLAIYIDDIMITGSDVGIDLAKDNLVVDEKEVVDLSDLRRYCDKLNSSSDLYLPDQVAESLCTKQKEIRRQRVTLTDTPFRAKEAKLFTV